jgi:ring-1,2-phenylacetyl-CoA epoxidase subunit PaaD
MTELEPQKTRSSRAKSRGAGTESETRPSTTLGTNEVCAGILEVLRQVPDPEIPVLCLLDLGIIRSVTPEAVTITPTYTGCPATQVIEADIRAALDAAGYRQVRIETALSPAWTTDWITPEGRAKLLAYGIAPPMAPGQRAPACPQCGSTQSEEISRFGSTPCKSLWRCRDCLEPFDLFKCH